MITINRKQTINWDTPLVISQLSIQPNQAKTYFEQFKKNSAPDITDEMIIRAVNNLIIENTVFNHAMDMIVQNYDISYTNADLTNVVQGYRQNYKSLATAPDAYLYSIAANLVIKDYIFKDLAKEWNITISDDDVKNTLEEFYKKTNISIRDEMSDKNKFEAIRDQLFERRMIQEIVARVKPSFNWDQINKQFATLEYK